MDERYRQCAVRMSSFSGGGGSQRNDMEVKGIKHKDESVLYPEEYLYWFMERSSTENTQIKSDFEIFGAAFTVHR